jgi:hypothetical protein
MNTDSHQLWSPKERKILRRFRHPIDIQLYLNKLDYNPDSSAQSPRTIISTRTAHCFEGALFAAAALRMLGFPPLLVDMEADNDDDHVIAVFRINGHWGAVAKSNTTVLRFREPVYRSIRELVMSYFDMYFNTKGYKTLRTYSRPLNLSRFDRRQWITSASNLDYIGEFLYTIPHTKILTATMRRRLSKADPDIKRACFMGSKTSGLFKPR